MIQRILICAFILGFFLGNTVAQGPPITADKPIMLGKGSVIFKTLTEIRDTDEMTWVSAPLMVHYLPTSNSLVGIHIPFVNMNAKDVVMSGDGAALGDIQLLGKYQFYRKDQTGKTFRMVAKTLQTIPIMEEREMGLQDMGVYQSYLGIVAGLESIKYGISNELGYNFIPSRKRDELRYKLGFGLPLLKPSYPVNQINLYFEYANNWAVQAKEFEMLYAQGIQYARRKLTYEVSVQFPLIQTLEGEARRNYSVFLGMRYAL